MRLEKNRSGDHAVYQYHTFNASILATAWIMIITFFHILAPVAENILTHAKKYI